MEPLQRQLNKMYWNKAITQFYEQLDAPHLPSGIEALLPFREEAVREYMNLFYARFYRDAAERYMLIGINPGRYGGGVTGIPFTDPIRLEDVCNIHNPYVKKAELSSQFMYHMMEALGGHVSFFRNFYITSVSPVGFVRGGTNLNYYDDKALMAGIEPYVVACMEKQLRWPVQREVCFCIGEGKNLEYLQALNSRYQWFLNILPLPHPRYIMQYQRKALEQYTAQYVQMLKPWM